jgi:hypothetical protein
MLGSSRPASRNTQALLGVCSEWSCLLLNAQRRIQSLDCRFVDPVDRRPVNRGTIGRVCRHRLSRIPRLSPPELMSQFWGFAPPAECQGKAQTLELVQTTDLPPLASRGLGPSLQLT